MRKEPLLTAVPPAPVQSLTEFYAIAFDLAEKAAGQYGALAERVDENFRPVGGVFKVLAARERDRAGQLSAACLAACGKRPDPSDLRWAPIDLVPAAEIADICDSSRSTPYTAWRVAARHALTARGVRAPPPPARLRVLDIRHRSSWRSVDPAAG